MTTIRADAREIMDADSDVTRREAIRMAAALPRDTAVNECDFWALENKRTAIVLPGYVADDGNCEVEYPHATTGREAAEQYVADGNWGDDGGAVKVSVWRVGYDGADGAEVRVEENSYIIDIDPDHESLIRNAAGRDTGLCGTHPDDHEWTREGEGGCDENPGVWSLGGTAMAYREHCAHCDLRRSVRDPGSQRNPGEGVSYSYKYGE